MKTINLPIVFYDQEFRFNSFWGCLTCKAKSSNSGDAACVLSMGNPYKAQNVDAVDDPFKMKTREKSRSWKTVRYAWLVKMYAKLLTWLCIHCYPLTNVCRLLQLNIFADAGDASLFYYSIYPSMKRQQTLCLPRALFIATTSRRFRQHGTLFVGAFLPTVRMHAWVVEDGMPADCFDNQWIYFRPVMMLL